VERITSWKDLQERSADLVERVNADQGLAVAAAANPLFALAELGFDIEPEVRQELEDRFRFRPEDARRIGELRQEIFRETKRRFDLRSGDELRQVLEELGVRIPPNVDPGPPPRPGQGEEVDDPLAQPRGAHPVLKPLLEYRRRDAGTAALAPRELYDEVRRGELETPVLRIHATLKND
jgi:hypothetical protein